MKNAAPGNAGAALFREERTQRGAWARRSREGEARIRQAEAKVVSAFSGSIRPGSKDSRFGGLALLERHRALPLRNLASEQLADLGQREEMRIDEREKAALVELAKLVPAKVL